MAKTLADETLMLPQRTKSKSLVLSQKTADKSLNVNLPNRQANQLDMKLLEF